MPYPQEFRHAFGDIYTGEVVFRAGTVIFRGESGEEPRGPEFPGRFVWFTTHIDYATDYAFQRNPEPSAFRTMYKAEITRDISLSDVTSMLPIAAVFHNLRYRGDFRVWQRENMVLLRNEVLGGEGDGIHLEGGERSDEFLFDTRRRLIRVLDLVNFQGEKEALRIACRHLE